MDPIEKEALRKSQVFLVQNIILDDLWDYLKEDGIFTDAMLEDIQCAGTKKEQVRRLLSDLPRRGSSAFKKFLTCLRNTDQSYIADHLTEIFNSLKYGSSYANVARSVTSQPQQSTASTAYKESNKHMIVDNDKYAMDSCKVLIINNYFNNEPMAEESTEILKTRTGTDKDERSLSELFSKFHFQWGTENNLNAKEMLKKIETYFSCNELSALILVILTHGDDGILYCNDGKKVKVQDVVATLQKFYQGKPKMLIIQACRGGEMNLGVNASDALNDVDTIPLNIQQEEEKLIEQLTKFSFKDKEILKSCATLTRDMFIMYSTVPGFASIRNTAVGSWFVQDLCKVFGKYASMEDVQTLGTRLNYEISQRVSKIRNSGDLMSQISQQVSTLQKKWFLLYSPNRH